MEFSVVEKRDNDRFVLYDMQNKGKACASKYTINQLVAKGHKVYGVDGKKITICSIQGKPITKTMSYPNIEDTKRSLATFEKGIKPSRTEKKANKEKAAKKKQTIKAKKESAKKEKERLEIRTFKRLKSKPLFELTKEELWGAEYREGGKYFYKVKFSTPAAQAIVNRMLKDGVIHSFSFGKISNGDEVYSEMPIDSNLYNCQISAANTVHFEFENYYTSESVYCNFYKSENYEFNVKNASFHHADENISIGCVADGGGSLKSEGIWLRKKVGNVI